MGCVPSSGKLSIETKAMKDDPKRNFSEIKEIKRIRRAQFKITQKYRRFPLGSIIEISNSEEYLTI